MLGKVIGELIAAKRKNYTNKEGKDVTFYSIMIADEDGFRDEEQVFSCRVDESLVSLIDEMNKNRGKKYELTGKWTTYEGRKMFTAYKASLV